MRCFTVEDAAVTEGILLHKDAPSTSDGKPRYFLHVQPDHYGEVKNVEALLASGCARYEGDSVLVSRCTIIGGELHPVDATADDGKMLVLGAVDHVHAKFDMRLSEPPSYRTALGPNTCFTPIVLKHNGRGDRGQSTGHEQFAFLGVFNENDRLDANIIFVEDDGKTAIDFWANGTLLSASGGELHAHRLPVIRRSERFTALDPSHVGRSGRLAVRA
jgi:hypothetical protein